MSKLLREAYARAGLETLRRGLWHPWKRKRATECKHMPLNNVAKAGGWKCRSSQALPEALKQRVLTGERGTHQ